jgi:hypothetical protein
MKTAQTGSTILQVRPHQESPRLLKRPATVRLQKLPHVLTIADRALGGFMARVDPEDFRRSHRGCFNDLVVGQFGSQRLHGSLNDGFLVLFHLVPLCNSINLFFSFDRA